MQTTNGLAAIKKALEKQRLGLEKQIVRLRKEDPFLLNDRSRVEEPGTVAMEEEGHTRIAAEMNEAEVVIGQINRALQSIENGKYGICEKCGKVIPEGRLHVFPMATLCLTCETKKERRTR